ncbi:hypothetical protein SS1G_09048 [Sclerotinia sclerotiorum 1980 UF-70]|uniref:Uncharacterized protein n=1 Tax=Sclerotinia sclerotiorum (strain ATCC 18683 / 1980 / Ss-1) TaxID=665079 RepID=A7EUP0_SCLS1|nr:hypothetical protein SS1G_09048 [Sclerotinia sclerotiorum 1980 UF-70]EDN93182.1 hypothetical protein SS1G_09048 [Sclerotinia sclerotiorum 1980 UF-70]
MERKNSEAGPSNNPLKVPAASFPTHNSPRVWFMTSALSPLCVRLIRLLLKHGDYVAAGLPPKEIEDDERCLEFKELINDYILMCCSSEDPQNDKPSIESVFPILPSESKDKLVMETVHALTAIGGHENPPARHIVGYEGIASVKEKLKIVSEEMEDFVEVSCAVDIYTKSAVSQAALAEPRSQRKRSVSIERRDSNNEEEKGEGGAEEERRSQGGVKEEVIERTEEETYLN